VRRNEESFLRKARRACEPKGLAATALKEHPRKAVLLCLPELRDAMIVCQKAYDDYQAVLIIRQNFKVEEVFAAQKHVKAWSHPRRFCGEYWLAFD
jgi:hypothetical protein